MCRDSCSARYLVWTGQETIVLGGFIHYSKDRVNVQIDLNDENRRRTLKMIREIEGIIEEEIEPMGTRNPGRCTDCEYSRYCEGHKSEEIIVFNATFLT